MNRRTLTSISALVGFALLIAGIGSASAAGKRIEAGCSTTKPAAASVKKPQFAKPSKVLDARKQYAIIFNTSCGKITVVLDQKLGGPIPNSVAFLVKKKFYDGLTFHRIIKNFVVQGGDPKGSGCCGPGYSVVKALPGDFHYKLGDFAMAKTGSEPSGTAGSQFFDISGPDGVNLSPLYGLLGHAADRESLKTTARLQGVPLDSSDPNAPVPVKPLYIISASLKLLG